MNYYSIYIFANFMFWSANFYAQDWVQHTIDSSSSGADGIKFGDVNEDGLLDIVTGWEEGGITKLYLHPGIQNVRQPWPSVTVGTTRDVEDAVFADMNADGVLDIVSATEGRSRNILVHFASGGNVLDPSNWNQAVLSASVDLMMWMYLEPLQLDDRNGLDLIAAGKGKDSGVGWFEAPHNSSDMQDWSWHRISNTGWVMSIILRDIDNDGDVDIVLTDRKGELQGCRWLENPEDLTLQKANWKNHFVGAQGLEVMFMTMGDLDMDGIDEVILTERSQQTIRIFKRESNEDMNWSEEVINVPTSTGKCKSVEIGDLNNDGIIDIVLSTNTEQEEKVGLTWIDGRSLEHPNEIDFKAISGVHVAKYDRVELIDIDHDGDLDVLICEENYGSESKGLGVIWYENRINK